MGYASSRKQNIRSTFTETAVARRIEFDARKSIWNLRKSCSRCTSVQIKTKDIAKMCSKTSVSSVPIQCFFYFIYFFMSLPHRHCWWADWDVFRSWIWHTFRWILNDVPAILKWEMMFLCHFITVRWKSIKAILIGFSLTGINLFSGTFAMINYTANIFKESGSTLDPHISSIIVAVIQILGVYGSTLLVDRVGRKTLLIFSTSGAFVGLMSLGTYAYLNEHGYDLTTYNWIPLLSFSTFIFISCFGILPLPFIVLTEILPAEVILKPKNKWKKQHIMMTNE